MQALFYLEAQTGAENIEYIIHYDSKYACNMATGDWFPKTNYHIVAVLKKVHTAVIRHRKIQLQWVKGHSKVIGNELADRAADRGGTALLPTGGRCSTNGTPTVDCLRLTEAGMPFIDNAELSTLQKTISAAAHAAFELIICRARKPWISQGTLTLMDRAALARSWGHTAQEQTIQKLIKKSARRDKAMHTKTALAEAAADKTGKLLYNNIKSTKKRLYIEKALPLQRRHAASAALQSGHLRRTPPRSSVGTAAAVTTTTTSSTPPRKPTTSYDPPSALPPPLILPSPSTSPFFPSKRFCKL
jgi:hypothetical protein